MKQFGGNSIDFVMDPADWQEWPHAFVETEDGIRVHFVDVGPKDGLSVVMVHGWPDLWFGWRVRPASISIFYFIIQRFYWFSISLFTAPNSSA